MDPLLYARSQMGLSLAFHIIFAAAGVALPLLMAIADTLHWRTGDDDWLNLSKRLAKGTAVLFAVGAVSGTVLSFELGLLWPKFMGTFGEVIGIGFSLEGFAFFTEAIFLGIYLYGRTRISRGFHLFSAYAVAASGAASAFFVTLVNAIMNLPSGFRLENGMPVDIEPWVALFSPSWRTQTAHVLVSCYQAAAFAMAGIHAFVLLRHPTSTLHQKALKLAIGMAAVAAVIQPVIGDFAARHVAQHQPWKLAAMEAQFETERGAPLTIGGIPDEEKGTVSWSVEIPKALSLLGFHDPDAEVKGLREFPRDEWPPVAQTHYAFQVMVGTGTWMALLSVFTLVYWAVKKRLPPQRRFLWAWTITGPLGIVAMEAGWLVTEWGRQPWIVHGMMRTAEAVTPFPSLAPPFWTFTFVYLLLGVVVVALLVGQVKSTLPATPSPVKETAP